jgi:uncharacterized protein (DUF433 family)
MSVLTLRAPTASQDANTGIRFLLSLKEAVVLADVQEKPVRKDIEVGILDEPSIHRAAGGRLYVNWDTVFVIAAVYGNRLLSSELRKVAISQIEHLNHNSINPSGKHSSFLKDHISIYKKASNHIKIDKFASIDLSAAWQGVIPRVELYAYGLTRIHERDEILGGEAVFKNSRLPVTHVGKMVESGETAKNIVEDYPYLNDDDVRFSSLYYRAHPTTGRPRKGGDADVVSPDSR